MVINTFIISSYVSRAIYVAIKCRNVLTNVASCQVPQFNNFLDLKSAEKSSRIHRWWYCKTLCCHMLQQCTIMCNKHDWNWFFQAKNDLSVEVYCLTETVCLLQCLKPQNKHPKVHTTYSYDIECFLQLQLFAIAVVTFF